MDKCGQILGSLLRITEHKIFGKQACLCHQQRVENAGVLRYWVDQWFSSGDLWTTAFCSVSKGFFKDINTQTNILAIFHGAIFISGPQLRNKICKWASSLKMLRTAVVDH